MGCGQSTTKGVTPRSSGTFIVHKHDTSPVTVAAAAKRSAAARKDEQTAYIRAKVDRAISRIYTDIPQLDAQWEGVSRSGTLPAELAAVVTAETLDGIGTMYCTLKSLKSQRLETKQKLALSPFVKNRTSNVQKRLEPIRESLATEEARLDRAVAAIADWGLDLDALAEQVPTTAASVSTLCQTLPLAVTDPGLNDSLSPTDLTVQRLLGVCVVKHKTRLAAAALAVYNRRRGHATRGLVAIILGDIEKYTKEYERVTADADADRALSRLEKLGAQAPMTCRANHEPLGMAAAETLVASTADVQAPRTTRVEYTSFKRMEAGRGSVAFYNLICGVVSSAKWSCEGALAHVIPGGVKKLARYVFKTVTKYQCDFLSCKDLIRCTIVTTSLTAIVGIVRAIFDCPEISVVRVKNRFARSFDPKPQGGYRDYQMLVVFNDGTGKWLFAEVQVNLEQMVTIKSQPNGGHAVYKFARSLAAFDEKTYTHSGYWSKQACKQIASGVLLSVDMQGGFVGIVSRSQELADALLSSMCRVQDLNLQYNDLGPNCAHEIACALRGNKSVLRISLGGNKIGPDGALAMAAALKENRTLTSIDLTGNKIDDKGGIAIAEALETNKVIRELCVAQNDLARDIENEIEKQWDERGGTLVFELQDDGGPPTPATVEGTVSKAYTKVTTFCSNMLA
mmetsp:Transcript_33940/g.89056  ORF Transcript_33940/g.89056 Transcript_33940/m.89056 type:complete len:680 (+) Transcript_33940:163-2202(+)